MIELKFEKTKKKIVKKQNFLLANWKIYSQIEPESKSKFSKLSKKEDWFFNFKKALAGLGFVNQKFLLKAMRMYMYCGIRELLVWKIRQIHDFHGINVGKLDCGTVFISLLFPNLAVQCEKMVKMFLIKIYKKKKRD